MKLTSVMRGVGFGNLGVFVRGLVFYRLSPYQLKTFTHISQRISRMVQRTIEEAIYIVPNTALAYYIWSTTEKTFDKMCRKNPEDYVNDK